MRCLMLTLFAAALVVCSPFLFFWSMRKTVVELDSRAPDGQTMVRLQHLRAGLPVDRNFEVLLLRPGREWWSLHVSPDEMSTQDEIVWSRNSRWFGLVAKNYLCAPDTLRLSDGREVYLLGESPSGRVWFSYRKPFLTPQRWNSIRWNYPLKLSDTKK
jgi:hypothetical protein